jgi:hypothetical protein
MLAFTRGEYRRERESRRERASRIEREREHIIAKYEEIGKESFRADAMVDK